MGWVVGTEFRVRLVLGDSVGLKMVDMSGMIRRLGQ